MELGTDLGMDIDRSLAWILNGLAGLYDGSG
jgi:hypothetical protein